MLAVASRRSIGASAPAAFGKHVIWDWLLDADSIPGWIRAASAALRSTSPAPTSHVYAADTDIRAPMLDATERATHAPCAVEKLSGWRGLPARLFVAYWNVSVAVLGRHGGTVYGSEANAPTFGARTQSLVVACRAAESLRAAMAWVANRVAAISAADTKVILVICLSIWWQKPSKRSTSCYEERPAFGDISSRAFNEA